MQNDPPIPATPEAAWPLDRPCPLCGRSGPVHPPPIVPLLAPSSPIQTANLFPLSPTFASAQGKAAFAPSVPALPAFPPQPPKAPITSGLRVFFQEHALKLIFALATVLVLIALRGLIAWESVGAIALQLVPVLTLGMTAMFGLFGQRTHRENPWAAFVYNGLAALLLGFDSLVIAKYWLANSIPLRPALFFAAGIATLATGYYLRRLREIPYLHLFHAGALSTLYLLLQLVRTQTSANDFRPMPLSLFGSVYLCYAAVCFLMARLARQPTRLTPSALGARSADSPDGYRAKCAVISWLFRLVACLDALGASHGHACRCHGRFG